MIIETAIGISVNWLLERVSEKVHDFDERRAVKVSLTSSIKASYSALRERNPNLANIIFDDEFLRSHLCPEISKLLTRNLKPDVVKIIDNLPAQALVIQSESINEDVQWLIDTIWEDFKKHSSLQDLINHRQIEESSQKVDNILSKQDALSEDFQSRFEQLNYKNIQQQQEFRETLITAAITAVRSEVNPLRDLMESTLPASVSHRIDTLLNKQLDRVKAYLNQDKLNEAYELLDSLKEEVATSDSYTRFRWHTNIGAYHLAMGDYSKAAAEFFSAHCFAPNDEKANANKIRAFLLQSDYKSGLELSKDMLEKFPNNEQIWSLFLNALKLSDLPTENIEVPNEIKHSTSILHIQSELSLDRGEYAEAYRLCRQAQKNEPDSQELKRAILRAALTWATVDKIRAHYFQISPDIYKCINYALSCFGDPIQYLHNIQSPAHFIEVAFNLAIALKLIGDLETNKAIVSYSYSRAPDREEFLTLKIQDLMSDKETFLIKELTSNKLKELSTEALFLLYEFSANEGDLEWSQELHTLLEDSSLSTNQKSQVLGLNITSLWLAGKKEAAIKCIQDNYSEVERYTLLKTLYIRILDESGEIQKRDFQIESLKSSEALDSLELLQIADVLYDFKQFYRAAECYEPLIDSPADNYLTKRYISALIFSNQRSKAQKILEELPEELANKTDFRRLKSNLAHLCGDLQTLTDTLYRELQDRPQDSDTAIWYISAMFRKNELEVLKTYINSAPIYLPLIVDNEFEIAKYEIQIGFANNALRRIYKAFQSAPNDPKVAGLYILTMLLIQKNEIFKEPEEAVNGSCVTFESNDANHSVVLQPKELKLGSEQAWTECIDDDSDIAKQILGSKVDEILDLGPGKRNAKVLHIKSIFIFALEKAHEVISKSVSNHGPIWSINMIDSKGELAPSEMIDSLKSRKAHVYKLFEIYKGNKLPLDMLARALGTDLLSLLLEWPYKEYELFVCSGSIDEREKTKKILRNKDHKFVLDMSSLVELNRLGLLHDCVKIIGKPLISLSLKETIRNILRCYETQSPSGFAFENEGKIVVADTTEEFSITRKKFISEILEFIEKHCEVCCVIGPASSSPFLAEIGDLVTITAQDAIYLSLERNAILISEDYALKQLAKEVGIKGSSWIQPIIMLMRDDGIVTQEKYSASVKDKLLIRHNFTSVDANDLLCFAANDHMQVDADTVSIINSFASPNVELYSVIKVCSQFLYNLVGKTEPEILKSYFLIVENTLKSNREQHVRFIREKLRTAIISAAQKNSSEVARKISGTFKDLLLPIPFNPKLKKLTASVNKALYL